MANPLDTIAEGERLLAAYTKACESNSGVVESAAGDEWQVWVLNNAPALLAVARAAATLCAHENTQRRPQYERAFADDDALGVLAAALDRLTPENPDAT